MGIMPRTNLGYIGPWIETYFLLVNEHITIPTVPSRRAAKLRKSQKRAFPIINFVFCFILLGSILSRRLD